MPQGKYVIVNEKRIFSSICISGLLFESGSTQTLHTEIITMMTTKHQSELCINISPHICETDKHNVTVTVCFNLFYESFFSRSRFFFSLNILLLLGILFTPFWRNIHVNKIEKKKQLHQFLPMLINANGKSTVDTRHT